MRCIVCRWRGEVDCLFCGHSRTLLPLFRPLHAEEAQSISGSLYYKSPEMLLRYDFADYSTDIWSLGCVFAALLFRTPIYFTAETPTEQILLIAKVCGVNRLYGTLLCQVTNISLFLEPVMEI